jgi:hypothetical protein
MPGRALLAGLLLLAVLLAATLLGLEPPPPLPTTAPAAAFSAERALPPLRRILAAAGDGVPHPAASAAGARVRDAVVAEFRALGLEPRVADSLSCNRYLTCTPVSNVIARVPGRAAGHAVLVSAHHDSVPAGPGAADDGSGVAVVLELARALRAEPADSDVILLVDDAEEAGLGGAEAFLAGPGAREVGAIVNLEARGTSGPSLLFETTGPGGAVVGALADGARRPVGSSLLSTVYRLLPNDTNLTVLRRLPVPGGNLAFIRGAARYHTPADDLAHLDPRSVQHQGENALALVRGLARAAAPGGEVVWFDLLGVHVVRFPVGAALPLALASLALALGLAFAEARRGRARGAGIAIAIVAVPISVAAAALLGFGIGRATGLDQILRPWVATPGPLVAAGMLAGLAAAALPACLPGRLAGPHALRAGVRVALAAGATALAATLPGASYLLLAPALVGGLGALLVAGNDRRAPVADLATLLAAGLVLLPPAWLLEPALGHAAAPAVAAVLALVALPLSPLVAGLPRRGKVASVAAPAALAAACLAVTLALPVADADAPAKVIVYFHQDADSGTARILASSDVGRLPSPVREAAPFSANAEVRFGWGTLRPAFAAEAAPLPLPGPVLDRVVATRDGDAVHFQARLRSLRGADELQVVVPPSAAIRSFQVDGVPVPPPVPKLSRWYGGWWVYRILGRPEGVTLDVVAASPGPLEIVVADQTPGLPPEGARVALARPTGVVTQQEGDVTLFTRRVRIEATQAPVR